MGELTDSGFNVQRITIEESTVVRTHGPLGNDSASITCRVDTCQKKERVFHVGVIEPGGPLMVRVVDRPGRFCSDEVIGFGLRNEVNDVMGKHGHEGAGDALDRNLVDAPKAKPEREDAVCSEIAEMVMQG